MYLSTRLIVRTKLKSIKTSSLKYLLVLRRSDEYAQITITYEFRTGFLLDRTSKTFEILVFPTITIFPPSTSLHNAPLVHSDLLLTLLYEVCICRRRVTEAGELYELVDDCSLAEPDAPDDDSTATPRRTVRL